MINPLNASDLEIAQHNARVYKDMWRRRGTHLVIIYACIITVTLTFVIIKILGL